MDLFPTTPRRSQRTDPDGALFGDGNDPSSRYRYVLWRTVDPANPRRMVVIGVNPSTADASEDDPTIRRCRRFALDSGHGQLVMLNLFAWRATDVRELGRVPQPFGGTEHGRLVDIETAAADTVVCAWGSSAKLPASLRPWPANVAAAMVAKGLRLHVLRLTAKGDPEHPLYLPASCRPVPWSGDAP